MEQQRELAVVDRDLRDHGAQRAEPERSTDAGVHRLAVAHVLDVGGRRPAQVSGEGIASNVSHGDRLESMFIVVVTITRRSVLVKVTINE
ncbi:hypothetical protein GCM10023349_15970 [Nocardioides conyzicola]|uniref:Uncharacterized protein n=1 Tax=Nocardioides conyzicola TaxID=1651781 RepID=A0ABP8X5I5_9ACTN